MALPLPWFVQSRSPALADIMGARRVRTAVWRETEGERRTTWLAEFDGEAAASA